MRRKKILLLFIGLFIVFICIKTTIAWLNTPQSFSFKRNAKFIPLKNIELISEDQFTIVVLPDTQRYSKKHPHIFDTQTQWIVNNKDALNIVFVTHLGDIVHNGDEEKQWKSALNSMKKLDGIVPYSVLPGNHDMTPKNNKKGNSTLYNQYFPASKFEKEPWWGGNYPKNKNDNNYQLFSAGSLDFIILHLEADPRDDVLIWAKKILDKYSDRMAIISTHIYSTRSGNRKRTPRFRHDGNSGKDIWDKLIKNHPNIFMVLCGHVGGEEARRVSKNNHGKSVFEIMQNYQHRKNGGNGWLRYYVFKPLENKIYAYTCSLYLKKSEIDNSSQFILNYDFETK